MISITAIALIAAGTSIFLQKHDKLVAKLLSYMLKSLFIHHARIIESNSFEIFNILKSISLAVGAFVYTSITKDSTYVK